MMDVDVGGEVEVSLDFCTYCAKIESAAIVVIMARHADMAGTPGHDRRQSPDSDETNICLEIGLDALVFHIRVPVDEEAAKRLRYNEAITPGVTQFGRFGSGLYSWETTKATRYQPNSLAISRASWSSHHA